MRICFIAWGAYPLLAGRHSTYVIGPDVLQVLLAKELIKHDFEITLITRDDGGAPVEYLDGIEVIRTCREGSPKNLVAKVIYQFRVAFSIWKAIRKAKAHVYFHQGAPLCVVALFCRLAKKQFVVSVGSDAWVSDWRSWLKGEFKGFNLVGRFIYELDIRVANVVIVMNEFQRALLKKNFGKDGLLIKHHIPVTARATPEKAKPPIVLWVGSMAEVKQPELFVKLAEAIPDGRFQMIGGHFFSTQELDDRMKQRFQRIPNFEALGVIPFGEVHEYFSRAAILVNTSMFEGFPHAFIQAWVHCVPVVSLNADPDEIICKYKLGFHSKTFQQLVGDVKILLENEQLRKEMGENGRQYVEKEHDMNKIVEQYIKVFKRVGKD